MSGPGPLGAASAGWSSWTTSEALPILAAAVLLSVCLWCLFPTGGPVSRWRRLLAGLSGAAGLAWLWTLVPSMESISVAAAFWSLSVLTLAAALATISSTSPVYSAIWFAASLLGTAGLFLLQGAQFVSIATVAVYAGAIVVTFLFVLMLAQPEGHTFYDRIGWGFTPRLVGTLAAVSFAVLIAASLNPVDSEQLSLEREQFRQVALTLESLHGEQAQLRALQVWPDPGGQTRARMAISASADVRSRLQDQLELLADAIALGRPEFRPAQLKIDWDDVRSPQHMATLGGQLFSRHLIAIEVVGTLLFVALVGAIAMVSRDTVEVERSRESQA